MVPTEIVDDILSYLHSEEDYTTLEICSTIFPQSVDRQLYSHITFYTNSPPPTYRLKDGNYIVDPTKFSVALIDRPHVANYVRSIRIFVQNALASKFLSIISSNLSMLSHLESITIILNRSLPWTSLDPVFRTALQNSIRLPSIREVEISNINDSLPLDIFGDCKNLERLQLFSRCTGGGAVSMPHLRSFGIESRNDLIMPTVISWIRSTSLHSLSLRMYDPMDIPNFRTLIEACSATLVTLELDHRSYVGTQATFPVQLPLLERVIIRATHSGHSISSLPVPFFSSLPSTRPVRLCLHLRFSILPGTPWCYFSWYNVAAFVTLPIFRHPRAIELCTHETGGTPLAEKVSSFKQNSDMRRLIETGELVIK